MAKRITYLLGAGASANTIPIVADMHERMKEMALHFYRIMRKYVDQPDHTKIHDFNQELYNYLGTLDRIYNDLDWLIKEAGNYYTIDTLARKFYLTNDNSSLAKLKKCLITYFTLEQVLFIQSIEKKGYNFVKDRMDKRYGSFLAAITQKLYKLPGKNPDVLAYENLPFAINGHIKILSWNYDMQIELSIQSLLTHTIIQHVKKEFQILPNRESKDEVNNISFDPNRFAMVKLNGDALWDRVAEQNFKNRPTIFDGNSYVDSQEEILINFLKSYVSGNIEKNLDNEKSPVMSFNFAWENDNNFTAKYRGHSKNLDAAEKIASETEILVVIGYSFPIFNREIDNRLFNRMEKLQKVYIQDKYPDRVKSTMKNAFSVLQEKIKVFDDDDEQSHLLYAPQKMKKIDRVEFQEEINTNQFVIPYELNQ